MIGHTHIMVITLDFLRPFLFENIRDKKLLQYPSKHENHKYNVVICCKWKNNNNYLLCSSSKWSWNITYQFFFLNMLSHTYFFNEKCKVKTILLLKYIGIITFSLRQTSSHTATHNRRSPLGTAEASYPMKLQK